jgi:hypothetical protein
MSTSPEESKNQFKVSIIVLVVLAGSLAILSVFFNLIRLTVIPTSTLWAIAIGVGAIATVVMLLLTRNKRKTKPVEFQWWIFIILLLVSAFTFTFGAFAGLVFLLINNWTDPAPIKKVTLPVTAVGTWKKSMASFVTVDIEGISHDVYMDNKSEAMTANYVDLTLQKGRFGYWVIREKSARIFPPN